MIRIRSLTFPVALSSLLLFLAPAARAQSKAADPKPAATKNSSVPPDSIAGTEVMDAHDPLFGVPAMPKGNVSLIGGTVQNVDPIRQRVTIRVFGNNKKVTFDWDERSHIYRDGAEAGYKALQKGAHVYVDSMLDRRDNHLLARNLRVVTSLAPADMRGQIMQYQPGTGTLVMRDELSSAAVTLRVDNDTKITGNGASSTTNLVPGSLVAIRFASGHGTRGRAREIQILAMPGSIFDFVGSVTHLDLEDGVIAMHNQSDDRTYELHFTPGTVGDNVTVGTPVAASVEFAGDHYQIKSLKITASDRNQAKSE